MKVRNNAKIKMSNESGTDNLKISVAQSLEDAQRIGISLQELWETCKGLLDHWTRFPTRKVEGNLEHDIAITTSQRPRPMPGTTAHLTKAVCMLHL